MECYSVLITITCINYIISAIFLKIKKHLFYKNLFINKLNIKEHILYLIY